MICDLWKTSPKWSMVWDYGVAPVANQWKKNSKKKNEKKEAHLRENEAKPNHFSRIFVVPLLSQWRIWLEHSNASLSKPSNVKTKVYALIQLVPVLPPPLARTSFLRDGFKVWSKDIRIWTLSRPFGTSAATSL